MKILSTAGSAAFLTMLATSASVAHTPAPADAFMARLDALCGQRFEGRVVTTDAADASFATEIAAGHFGLAGRVAHLGSGSPFDL